MQWIARVLDGVVQEPARDLPDDAVIADYFPASLPGTWEPAPDGSPQSGWTYADGVYTAPVPPAPSLAQQAAALLMTGLTIASTGTPAINSIYATNPTRQEQITAEIVSILEGNIFTDGATTIQWPDIGGVRHEFDIPTFRAFARAISAFVTGCVRVIDGDADQLPATSVTIA